MEFRRVLFRSSGRASGLVAAYHHVVHGYLQVFDLAALAAGLAAGQHHFLDVLAFGGRLDQLRAGLVGLLGEVDVAEFGLAGIDAAAATATTPVAAAPGKAVALEFALVLLNKSIVPDASNLQLVVDCHAGDYYVQC